MKKTTGIIIAVSLLPSPFSLLLSSIFVGFPGAARAEAADPVNLYFFWGEGCPHCAKEEPFLDDLAEKYPALKIKKYEVWGSAENRKLMIEVGNKINANVSGVPFTVVGEQYFVGWMDEKNTGAQIEEAVKCAMQNSCRDIGDEVINGNHKKDETVEKVTKIPETLTLPLIGGIKTKNLSLPVLGNVKQMELALSEKKSDRVKITKFPNQLQYGKYTFSAFRAKNKNQSL